MNVVLISTYELGHQPFGLASPAAWLRQEGARVACLDLAVERLNSVVVAAADLVAFYVPMHTATRIAASVVERVKQMNPRAHLCFYGLYAPANEAYLRRLGADTILGGEFEPALLSLYQRLAAGQVESPSISIPLPMAQPEPVISLAKQQFLTPDRSGLPALSQYARLLMPDGSGRITGYTEASRGCKHVCRHCPIVPVYGGRFRIVAQEVVLEDIRRQVQAGACHITFGDPDFFNGPGHAIPLVQAFHQQFPGVTYDVTIKIEHLLKEAKYLPVLRDTGCLFVTSAVESVDEHILDIFDKRHTREDFIRVVSLFREAGLNLNPTFVTFTPWTTLEGYLDLLNLLYELDLVENVPPIQYAIRLLIPAGSKLLELASVQELIGPFDEKALCYSWIHSDAGVDRLYTDVRNLVQESQGNGASRRTIFHNVWKLAYQACARPVPDELLFFELKGTPWQKPLPHLSESWFC